MNVGHDRSGRPCAAVVPPGPRLLRRDGQRVLPRARVVGADLRPDPVLERGDDLAARRVVLRIGAEHQQHVQPQPHGIALDLDVAFLQDVEEPDLHLAREIRQLVDGEDAAVGARQQAVVHRQLVAQFAARACGLDRDRRRRSCRRWSRRASRAFRRSGVRAPATRPAGRRLRPTTRARQAAQSGASGSS